MNQYTSSSTNSLHSLVTGGVFTRDWACSLRGLNGRLPCTGHADRPWGRSGLRAERPLVFAAAHTGSMPLGRHATRNGSAGRCAPSANQPNFGSQTGIQSDLASVQSLMPLDSYSTALKCPRAAMCQLKVGVNTYADTSVEQTRPLVALSFVSRGYLHHEEEEPNDPHRERMAASNRSTNR